MIWLIGNHGMLGTDVELLLKEKGIHCWSTDVECDITKPSELNKFAGDKEIKWIINCAAYTAVDNSENDRENAFRINAHAVKNLAHIASKCGAVIIHISTDYVFGGDNDGAYVEEDEPYPQTVYGKSKLAGERFLKEYCKKYIILRTAWLFGRYGSNFVTTMLHKFKSGGNIKIVDDQWGSPTYAHDLASVIVSLILDNCSEYGIYHTVNSGSTTWYRFAHEIYVQARELRLINTPVSLIPVPSTEYQTRAKRPMNAVLAIDKLSERLGITMRPWQEALKFFLENEFTFESKT